MGSWNQTCAITGNAIYAGDEVVAMWLLDGSPLPFHIRGEYNDYGAVENEHGPMLEEAMAFFKEYLYEMEEGENKYHDIPVKKDALDFKLLMGADHEERLFLNYNPYRWIDVPEKQVLSHIEIHASVFDELAKYDIQSYRGITYNVEYYVSAFQKYLEVLNEEIEGDSKTVALIRSLNRMRESEKLRYLISDGSGKRFSPNVFHFNMLRNRFLEGWENDSFAIEKFTNMAETFMVCSFLQQAGHAMSYPANIGQEDNSSEVIKLANITLKTAQQLSTRWDEE